MERYEKVIIRGLYSARKIGENYTNIDTLKRYFPKRERNMKMLKKAAKSLKKKGLLEPHKKDDCVSLSRSGKMLSIAEKEYL